LGINPLIIQSETVASLPKIQRLLPELEKAQVVIGTNVVTSPSKWIGSNMKYDLVIILAADQSLTLPDYSVRQDTFVQLNNIIHHTDAATILVQSYDTQHDSIRYACKWDEALFFQAEQKFREQHYYPPYGELCVIKYKNENESTLHNSIQALTKELLYLQQSYEYPSLTIYATPPLVYKKFGKFYYHIIVLGPKDTVRPFMDIAFSKLQMRKRWFKIDWMAHHIV
jgi:primosomal protein N' (replication factor Y)